MSYDSYDLSQLGSSWCLKRTSGPQKYTRPSECGQNNYLKIKKNLKKRQNVFPFVNFENPLYFRPNLKSFFVYQNGLESKKLF
jgi:hypothetical protein